jgi:GT2 family glycosyltransferase
VSGGNCAIWKDVALRIGWNEAFVFGASDIEFCWRAQLAGFRVEFVPSAVVRVRYRTTRAGLVKQYFRYGASEPHLFRYFRDAGMPRRRIADSLRTWGSLLARLARCLLGRESLGNWLRIAAGSLGRLWGSIRWRTMYL